MTLIDFDKFVASFITEMKECSQMRNFSIPRCIKKALDDQGLDYKNGEIIKTQRRVSAEAKENGYGESEDEEIVKLADEYYNKVLIKECGMKEEEAHHCRIAYIHGAKAMLDWLRCIKQRNTWKPSEEQMEALWCAAEKYLESDNANVVELRGKVLESLYNDLKKTKRRIVMKELIDKSDITAEIKKLRSNLIYGACSSQIAMETRCKEEAYNEVLSFIDTLETKEVDLEKETTYYLLYEHLSPLNEIMHKADIKAEMQYHKDIENAFKAGFELGLKSKG